MTLHPHQVAAIDQRHAAARDAVRGYVDDIRQHRAECKPDCQSITAAVALLVEEYGVSQSVLMAALELLANQPEGPTP